MLNSSTQLKSSNTLARQIHSKFENAREIVRTLLTQNQSKYSFTTDTWTSPAGIPFMAITVHFINEDWHLFSFLLDFIWFQSQHSGTEISNVFKSVIIDFKLKERLLAICADNASNNDTFIQDLLDTGYLKDREGHIRCFGHVLNLAAQDALREIQTSIDSLREGIKSLSLSPLKMEEFGRI